MKYPAKLHKLISSDFVCNLFIHILENRNLYGMISCPQPSLTHPPTLLQTGDSLTFVTTDLENYIKRRYLTNLKSKPPETVTKHNSHHNSHHTT